MLFYKALRDCFLVSWIVISFVSCPAFGDFTETLSAAFFEESLTRTRQRVLSLSAYPRTRGSLTLVSPNRISRFSAGETSRSSGSANPSASACLGDRRDRPRLPPGIFTAQ